MDIYGSKTHHGGICKFHDVGHTGKEEDAKLDYDVSGSINLPQIECKYRLNLQFFASTDGPGGEKTEPATPKKLSDARKEGQVAKSRELPSGLGLVALFLLLKIWIGHLGTNFLELFGGVYNHIPDVASLTGGTSPMTGMSILIKDCIVQLMLILLPIFAVAFSVAFLGDLIQVKWAPTTKPLQPKFSKLNPASGIRRIFSINSLVELVKSILKILLIGGVAYSYLKKRTGQLYLLYDMELMPSVQFVGDTVINLGLRISLIYMILALADYAYQKYKFAKDMRMTKQEVKDEFKNAEGDPEVKGRIKARMRQASQRRMMQALPQADVVITNPTHYAVAVKYDLETAPAPIVLAKGEDYLAQKIKEVARDNDIEIVENKPLARMLYANVEVGDMIPPELYNAVAEVLAYVYHLKGKA